MLRRIHPQFRHGAARLIFSFRIPPRKPKTPPPSALNASSLAGARVTEREQHAHTVGLEQEPGSQSMPSLLSLGSRDLR